jgi:hypothetical protein
MKHEESARDVEVEAAGKYKAEHKQPERICPSCELEASTCEEARSKR